MARSLPSSVEAVDYGKAIVRCLGVALGNLVYALHHKLIEKAGARPWGDAEREQVGSTLNYVLGGSIGTTGYTRVMLPLIALNQFRKISDLRGTLPPDGLRILAPACNSANLGALGAFDLAVPVNMRGELKDEVATIYAQRLLPVVALLDIGGTKINLTLASLNESGDISGDVMGHHRFPTPKGLQPEEFYARVGALVHSTLANYEHPPFCVLPLLAVGQPGLFTTPDGPIGEGTARDLGPAFPGSCPARLLAGVMRTIRGRDYRVFVCNDGRAAFYGVLRSLRALLGEKAWETFQGQKVIYLGLGTGLGAGYGRIRPDGTVEIFDLHNAFDCLARHDWEQLPAPSGSDWPWLPSPSSQEGYQYGDVLCGKFIRTCLHNIDSARFAAGKPPLFLSRSCMRTAPAGVMQAVLASNDPQSPLNGEFLNSLLADEVVTAQTQEIVERERPGLEAILHRSMTVISRELSSTVIKSVSDGSSQYNEVINEVAQARRRGRKVVFLGVGKSFAIGRTLSYIYTNLGLDSTTCELTGANSENLTNLHQDDVVFLISNSGRSAELLHLLPYLKRKGCRTVALTGTPASPLGQQCDFTINSHVCENPAPVAEAPTTSTTAALATATAIGVVVSHLFAYDKETFFLNHPGLETQIEFEGAVPDRDFDPLTRVASILRRLAEAIAGVDREPRFAGQLISLAGRILVSHFNRRTVFFTGTGSSLTAAEKIASTMTSVGIDAVAINASSLPHGEFAHIRGGDLLVIISFSGETRHLCWIHDVAMRKGADCALITAREDSTLGRAIELRVVAGRDAVDNGLVQIPDQKILSSFINLAVGDTLAVLLATVIRTSDQEFATNAHPGGAVGRAQHRLGVQLLEGLSRDSVDGDVCCRISNTTVPPLSKDDLISYLYRRAGAAAEAIIFGMGAVGLAYLAPILRGVGKELLFVEKDAQRVRAMQNNNLQYSLRPAKEGPNGKLIKIDRICVATLTDQPKLLAQSLRTDIAFTAVGVANLPQLIPILQSIIQRRYAFRIEQPINIVVCENLPISRDPLAAFRQSLRRALVDPDLQVYFDEVVGLVPAIDEAVVPEISTSDFAQPIPVEPDPPPLVIDYTMWKAGSVRMHPEWPNVLFTQAVYQHHLRKLWLHNMSHAMIGYLGHARKHKMVHEAIGDSLIEECVRRTLEAVGQAIGRRWGDPPGGMELGKYISWRIAKYKNADLGDTVARLCRDPLRKLAPEDRLIGPVRFMQRYRESPLDVPPSELLMAVVAAMVYAQETGEAEYAALRAKALQEMGIDSSLLREAEQALEAFRG